MRTKSLMVALFVAAVLMSFKNVKPSGKLKTGTYGICGCGDTKEGSLKVQLTINDDFTFHYFNNSNPDKIMDVKGNWTLTANTISLKNYHSDFPINNKWKIDRNEKCIRSRKGIEFTRLCHINSCK